MSRVKLLQGDCLELMKDIPDGSVDCIITDPPYMSAMQYNGHLTDYSDCNNLKPFFLALCRELDRVLTPRGSVYWCCDWRSYPFYFPILTQVLPVKNMLVWDKGIGPSQYYRTAHELVVFSTKNKQFRTKDVTSIIKSPSFSYGARKTEGEKKHPTQKPVALIELFLSHATNPGDTVLDCFMGSGTTGVACVRNGRNFIGMELQEKYFKIAKHRIKDEIKKAENHAEWEPFWNLTTGESNVGGVHLNGEK